MIRNRVTYVQDGVSVVVTTCDYDSGQAVIAWINREGKLRVYSKKYGQRVPEKYIRKEVEAVLPYKLYDLRDFGWSKEYYQ